MYYVTMCITHIVNQYTIAFVLEGTFVVTFYVSNLKMLFWNLKINMGCV